MLVAHLKIYLLCILAEMCLQEEFYTLQTGQADEDYSSCFVWLNHSQLLNTCFFSPFFDIITLLLVYVTCDCEERSCPFDKGSLRYTDVKEIIPV